MPGDEAIASDVTTTAQTHNPVDSPAVSARATCSPCTATPGEIRSVCQLQLEQLAGQIPLLAAWVVYYAPERGDRESVTYVDPAAEAVDTSVVSYLQSETWLASSLTPFQLSRLTLQTLAAYVYPFDPYSSNPEYLLLCTEQPLTSAQTQTIERAAQLLSYYLATYQECVRQQSVTQLLEQVIQRVEHQLRNPLALIGLYAENLRLELPAGAAQDQAMVIRETVNELSANLTNLVYCGQRSQLQAATYDLRTILIDSLRALQPWIEQKHLQVTYPATPVLLAVDCWQLKQVFSNLLHNAVHFSPEFSPITVNWRLFQREVLVEVCDRGPGLSPEDLQHAFTPFYSRRPGGTGLGLAIAKKIILDHQGNLWVKNLSAGGAQFSFTLPRP